MADEQDDTARKAMIDAIFESSLQEMRARSPLRAVPNFKEQREAAMTIPRLTPPEGFEVVNRIHDSFEIKQISFDVDGKEVAALEAMDVEMAPLVREVNPKVIDFLMGLPESSLTVEMETLNEQYGNRMMNLFSPPKRVVVMGSPLYRNTVMENLIRMAFTGEVIALERDEFSAQLELRILVESLRFIAAKPAYHPAYWRSYSYRRDRKTKSKGLRRHIRNQKRLKLWKEN